MVSITAIIVCNNEGHLLKKCIKGLDFCSEIILIDLKSTDDTINIACKLGAKVISHDPVSHVELIHSKIEQFTNNNWILIIDPDEEVSEGLKSDIESFFKTNKEMRIGAIRVPIQYFFKNKALKGTRWGGEANSRILIVNMRGFTFTPLVHEGRIIQSGFLEISIPLNYNKDNYLLHFWMVSYRQLINKHLRYIRVEGEAMYKLGNKYHWLRQTKRTFEAFNHSFFSTSGHKDGFTGLFLSVFWAWYTFMKWSSLRSFEQRLEEKTFKL